MSITVELLRKEDQDPVVRAFVAMITDEVIDNPSLVFNRPAVFNGLSAELGIRPYEWDLISSLLVGATTSGFRKSYSFFVTLARKGVTVDGLTVGTAVVVSGQSGTAVFIPGPAGATGTQGATGPSGSGGGSTSVQDEGTFVGTRPSLNFIGSQVQAVDDALNNRVNVTITRELPPTISLEGAVPVDIGDGTIEWRRPTASGVDPDFVITSWAKTAPNGGTLLYRRGDTVTGITASAAYASGPPTSAGVVNASSGSTGVGDVDPGSWTISAPFASATLAGSVKRSGSDAGTDPVLTATLTAVKSPFTRNSAFAIRWTSDVYFGLTSLASPTGADIFNATLQPGFQSSLQIARNGVFSPGTPSTQYVVIAWPSPYTGTPVFKDQNGFTFFMNAPYTTTITRNGVTRTYDVFRSAAALSSNFIVTVT